MRDESSIEFDTILDLCRDRHRRIILAVLADQQRSLTVNDLTKTVIRHNHQTPLPDVSGEVLMQVRLSLHHNHIPKLVDRGLIEYNPNRQIVKPAPQFDQLQPQLSAIIDIDPQLETPVGL